MKILFFGDIDGRIGRAGVKAILPGIKKKYDPDMVIANAENLSHGSGITEKVLKEMMEAGIDLFTSGNHIWDKGEAYEILSSKRYPIVRPANYPPNIEGEGYKVVEIGSRKVLIANLIGRVFFKEDFDCPFRKADEILSLAGKCDITFIDFHAEATSEKQALANYLDGRVDFFVGTHTHVQTADERILPKGTAYITDAGFCGAEDSIIGVEKTSVIKSFLTQIRTSFEPPEEGVGAVNAVLCTVENGKREIERIFERVKI